MADPEFWVDLTERGIVQQTTLPALGLWLFDRMGPGKKLFGYCGFDPTADSLHVGSLMPVLGLRRLMKAGLTPIVLVGGATGMIGDPSGKSAERSLLSRDVLDKNVSGMSAQLEKLFEGKAGIDFLLVNNADWLGPVTLLEFLRDIGKHFSVNMMMARESVRARLEDREHGISYTEFSYMLLQAYDYLHLFEKYDCRLQVGGSDQWGNIAAGIDLVHRKHSGAELHGLTFPLITTTSGQKFGKSERGAVWLDPKRTHPHSLYKYFFDTPDADVVRFLKYFTFLPLEVIADLERQLLEKPEGRAAQRALAREVTAIVHGQTISAGCEGLEAAMHADDAEAFETHASALGLLDPANLADIDPAILPVAIRPRAELQGDGLAAVDLAIELGLFGSKSDARREITGPASGFYVAGQRITDVGFRVTANLLGDRRVLQIRKGKKNKRMVLFPRD